MCGFFLLHRQLTIRPILRQSADCRFSFMHHILNRYAVALLYIWNCLVSLEPGTLEVECHVRFHWLYDQYRILHINRCDPSCESFDLLAFWRVRGHGKYRCDCKKEKPNDAYRNDMLFHVHPVSMKIKAIITHWRKSKQNLIVSRKVSNISSSFRH